MTVVVPPAFRSVRKERVGVAVLGATGSVGQRFALLLEDHPWFSIGALCASDSKVGQPYGECTTWGQVAAMPESVRNTGLVRWQDLDPSQTPLIFSALPSSVAEEVEAQLAEAGFWVVTNAAPHRMRAGVPLLVPEANGDHVRLLARQQGPGAILAGPNCSAAGLVLALAPLHRRFGVRSALVVTMQAHSGAGLPGVLGDSARRNVLPFVQGEENKLESEPNRILGEWEADEISPAGILISATCNRVDVLDGHTECVSLKLDRTATREEILACWAEPSVLDCPSAPALPVHYLDGPHAPNPRSHVELGGGMSTLVGQLRVCHVMEWRFTLLSHNTLRGAAGGAILIAEHALAAAERGSLGL